MNPSIWTPRYIVNRAKLFFYEKTHKEEPWIPAAAVRALENQLHKEMKGIEFGSGRSTVWYAQKIEHLTSVEDHKEWYDEVSGQLDRAGVMNVDYIFKSSEQCEKGFSDYCDYISSFKDQSLDFVVVDGKHRAKIANIAIQKLAAGGILLLDDSERYLAYPSSAPYSLGDDSVKMTDSWKSFKSKIAGWEAQVYTNGVSDTTLFLKP